MDHDLGQPALGLTHPVARAAACSTDGRFVPGTGLALTLPAASAWPLGGL